MKIGTESAALITGAGSGIGRAVALHLGKLGAAVTVVDFSEESGQETVRLLEEQRLHLVGDKLPDGRPAGIFVRCDVRKPEELASAFERHISSYGRLDFCMNNAGIGDKDWFVHDNSNDGGGQWRKVVDVNLVAVIDGTRLAARAMMAARRPGAIVNVASAAGLYPSPGGPVYSASKGGVVLFSRSLVHLSRSGIRVNALCPEYIETPLVKQVSDIAAKQLPGVVKALGGFISMDTIVSGVMELVEDDSKAGDCLWITNRLGKQYWPTEDEKRRYIVPGDLTQVTKAPEAQGPWSLGLPETYQKMIVHTLSADFRSATKILAAPLVLPVSKTAVLVKYYYAGVNASDVNYSAGRYFGSPASAAKRLPFDCGFEAVGVVVAAGEQVKDPLLQRGCPVATLSYGAFAEFGQVEAKLAIPVEEPSPQMVAMLTSGLTASIGLDQGGRMGSGETVLVTAAAGGTGQFAVQLAKLGGNKVVATCGGEAKAALLRRLGVDRVIDYRKEDVAKVLKEEFRGGVNLVYESVGGGMFDTCIAALAPFGRCVVIGMMSQYTAGDGKDWMPADHLGLCEKLLWKSQSLSGFFLIQYASHWRAHLSKLQNLKRAGLLKVAVDERDFCGLESVADAVDHLHSGASIGKVVVRLSTNVPPVQASRL